MLKGKIVWDQHQDLVLQTKGSIIFDSGAELVLNKDVSLYLKAGLEAEPANDYLATVKFMGDTAQIKMKKEDSAVGMVNIYYNPVASAELKHKYHNPKAHTYSKYVNTGRLMTYMLVNDIYDLQNIEAFLAGSYALGKDIDAHGTKAWNAGRGFKPIGIKDEKSGAEAPFCGNFDGNGHRIIGLFIDRPDEHYVGLFREIRGRNVLHNLAKNLELVNANIRGNHYVGTLAGSMLNCNLESVSINEIEVTGVDVVGGILGMSFRVDGKNLTVGEVTTVSATDGENMGILVGGAGESKFMVFCLGESVSRALLESFGNRDDQTEVSVQSANKVVEVH